MACSMRRAARRPQTSSSTCKDTIQMLSSLAEMGWASQMNASASALVSSTPQDPQPASPLFSLPAELRILIYEYAMIQSWSTSLRHSLTPMLCLSRNRFIAASKQTVLARTCRQLRNEVLPIFYGQNAFEIYHLPDRSLNDVHEAALWGRQIGHQN
jgi:hypothetical protein